MVWAYYPIYRQQAQLGIYPAIDISSSVSRVMNEIIDPDHSEYARVFRKLITLYMENRDLILMGGYTQGKDPDLDLAVTLGTTYQSYSSNGGDVFKL